MIRRRLVFVTSLFFVLPLCAAAQAGEPFHYQEARHGGGELKTVNGLPVLFVRGSPEQIGEQVAVLAAKQGKRIFDYPWDFLSAYRSQFLWPYLVRQGEQMVERFPATYRTELETLVKTSGIDRGRVVAGNTMFDLKKMVACSALVVEADRSATRGPLLGRNLDYASFGYAQQYSLVTVYRPAGKRAFASVGFPGLVGCLSGMNDAGLALAVLEIFAVKDPTEKFDPSGTPYALCYRRILEECATVDEAEALLRGMKRTTTTSLAICDKKGGAVLEITPKSVIRRPPVAGFCACTNHFCTEPLKTDRPSNFASSQVRFATLQNACEAAPPRITLEDLHRHLDSVNLGKMSLQTMIFEPDALTLHLAIGEVPSTKLPLRTLELGPLFRK
jgi:hypothetical protein